MIFIKSFCLKMVLSFAIWFGCMFSYVIVSHFLALRHPWGSKEQKMMMKYHSGFNQDDLINLLLLRK